METLAYRTCPLCEATCGLELQLTDGMVTRTRGDADDVLSHGFICPKGTTLGHFHEDPDRLRQPLAKIDGTHQPVSWDEAFRRIGEGFTAHRDPEENASAIYLGNPVVHGLDLLLYGRSITTALGTRNIYSASTVDQRPRELASGLLYGLSVTIPVPDIDRTDALLLMGANPYVSNGSLATAPDWPGRIEALKARGGFFAVVDPALTRTAREADVHLAIRPTTDVLLLAALATELVNTERHRPDPADAATLATVTDALAGLTPDTVADRVGISADDIRSLVSRLADAERPCVYARIGTTVTPFGTTASWLVDVVNALLGSLDRPGGAMFPTSPGGSRNTRSDDPVGKSVRLGRRRTSVSGLPVELGEHPVSALAEEIESGAVRAMVTVAGNPVLSCPDGERLDAAFSSLEFMVSIDCYLNETTVHADVILPSPSHLQKPHFDLAFTGLSVRNVANFSPAILPLEEGELPEWQVASRLSAVLGGLEGNEAGAAAVDSMMAEQLISGVMSNPKAPEGLTEAQVRDSVADRTGPLRLLELMVRSGPFGDWFGAGDPDGLSLARLEAAPHGIDLGPLVPRLPEALSTPSGRPEFAHPDLMADLPRVVELLDDDPVGLELINRRTLRSNNSWMHNLRILVKGRPRCTLLMHPEDADERSLTDGQRVRLSSSTGSIEVALEVTDTLRPGVVSMPHGWGHDRPGTRLQVAADHAGANVNIVTPSSSVDPLSGTSQLTGVPVEVLAV